MDGFKGNEVKRCRKCQQTKPTTAFAQNKKASDGLSTWCKNCRVEGVRHDRLKPENKERYQRYSWVQSLRKYGLTIEKYNAILESQNGVCAICGGKNKHSKQQYLNVDHCHETGKMRALLCNPCNLALGGFRDSVGLLRRAIAYLEYFNGR